MSQIFLIRIICVLLISSHGGAAQVSTVTTETATTASTVTTPNAATSLATATTLASVSRLTSELFPTTPSSSASLATLSTGKSLSSESFPTTPSSATSVTSASSSTGRSSITPSTGRSSITGASTPPADVMANAVFIGSGNSMITRCATPSNITWHYMTWKSGGIRGYYVNKGIKKSLSECVQECAINEECDFATMTAKNTCYLLTTTPNVETVHCRYLNKRHFGKIIERCRPLKPCPSAYKRCGQPNCALVEILKSYCKNRNKNEAVSKC